MDIPLPHNKNRKRWRQAGLIGGVLVAALAATVGLSQLEPAAPSVARSSVWVDTVRHGELLRQVRGPGTLVPREVRWIAAQTDGRIERILVRAGAVVEADTVIMELSNPDLVQQSEESGYAVEAAEAELVEMELRLRGQQLDQRAAQAVAHAEYEAARLQAEAERSLAERGIVPAIQYRRTELLVEQLKVRWDIENERLNQFSSSMEAQLAAQQAQLELVRNRHQRRLAQVDSLSVRAGFSGVLQQVPVEVGQRVTLGANLARVARPDELQAELRIAETQARDIAIGQPVTIDTRNGLVEGRVIRIDPAVQSGTVQVDVELIGSLPRGARPDLSVDGTIELERLRDVIFTGRPAYGQPHSTISLFKLTDNGRTAVRVPVELGRR
jgi:HlyD family secretion protein